MGEGLYSDRRWHDNPMPRSSLCGECKYWRGFLKCDKYEQGIPGEIRRKSYSGTEDFDENYCPYRVS